MVLSKEEILATINEIVGDSTDDKTLEFIENVYDTLSESTDKEDWKTKYEENDAMWRKKYKERFFQKEKEEKEEENNEDDTEPKTYADLFKNE